MDSCTSGFECNGEAFGWYDYSCATLVEVSRGQLKKMLRSGVCRCVEKDWAVDLGSKPKLCVLNSVCVDGFDGRCGKVKEESHRRVLMMLRAGTAPFQIETGRLVEGYPTRRENV